MCNDSFYSPFSCKCTVSIVTYNRGYIMNDVLNLVANLLKTNVCNVRIVKHKAASEYERNTYTIELLHTHRIDWLHVGRMNRGGSVTLLAPDKYSKVAL